MTEIFVIYIPLESQSGVPPGKRVTILVTPSVRLRPWSLLCGNNEIKEAFGMVSITNCVTSEMKAVGPVPLDIFESKNIWSEEDQVYYEEPGAMARVSIIEKHSELKLEMENISGHSVRFQGCLVGHTVDE